jgi:hypothetical protein
MGWVGGTGLMLVYVKHCPQQLRDSCTEGTMVRLSFFWTSLQTRQPRRVDGNFPIDTSTCSNTAAFGKLGSTCTSSNSVLYCVTHWATQEQSLSGVHVTYLVRAGLPCVKGCQRHPARQH